MPRFNPWVGCTKVSPGCKHCYAETLVTGRMGRGGTWGPTGTRERTSPSLWKKPLRWNALAAEGLLPDGTENPDGHRPRVFCASLADVFEDRPELDPWRRDLFDLIAATPNLDWLVLTKRPDLAAGWLRGWYDGQLAGIPAGGALPFEEAGRYWSFRDDLGWGVLPNLWIGTSIESTAYTWRADCLRRIPAPVRFISAEPLLGSLFTVGREGSADVDEAGEAGTRPAEDRPPLGCETSDDPVALASAPGSGQPFPSSGEPGEVTGENRTRPDEGGGLGDVQSAGASGPGSIPGLSTGATSGRLPDLPAVAGERRGTRAGATEVAPLDPRPLDTSDPAGLPASEDAVGRGADTRGRSPLDLTGIDWVIVGGESGGRNARPMHPTWVKEIRDSLLYPWSNPHHDVIADLTAREVTPRAAFHFKQWGSWAYDRDRPDTLLGYDAVQCPLAWAGDLSDTGNPYRLLYPMRYAGAAPTAGGKLLDGETWQEFPTPAAPA